MDPSDRVLFRAAVQELVEEARRQRGMLPLGSSERHFLLGVDAAALEVLHPELAQTRVDHWLDGESADFRDGYHRTRSVLAGAGRAGRVPTSIPIPHPDRPAVG